MNSIDNSYSSLFKSVAVGAAVSGACLIQEISPTYSVGVGCIAMFGTAFFFRLDKEYKEVFVPNLARLMQENKSVYIFRTRQDKNADFFSHRMKICSLYRKISAGAFFLKPLGWLKEKEVEILNQLKESKGHFAEKILEKK